MGLLRKCINISVIYIYRTFLFPLKKLYITFTKHVIFDIKAYADRKTVFEGYNSLGMEVFLSESSLGHGSYIADYSKIYRTFIGRYTSIGQCVNTAIGNHPISDNISTSPSFFSTDPRNDLHLVKEQLFGEYVQEKDEEYSIYIGNDVWIGNNVTILQGVRIGDGAVIGAGSVVTKDVEAYAVYVGNPARKIRYRFEPEEIQKLLALKWWEKDRVWIVANAQVFANPKQFFKDTAADCDIEGEMNG